MKTKEATHVLVTIENIYANFYFNKEQTNIWFHALLKMDYDRVMQKLMRFSLESRFPPTIADIKAYPPNENKHLAEKEQWKKEAELVSEEVKQHFATELEKLVKEKTYDS